jgi:hypothetical protein
MKGSGFAALRLAHPRRCGGMLLLACLAMSVLVAPALARPDDDDDDRDEAKAAAPVPQQVFQEGDFDQWIFQNNRGGLADVHRELATILSLRIDEIDRTCKLTEAQKKRLQLAARGDIKQFYVLYQKIRQKFLEVRHDPQKMDALWDEIGPLQTKVQLGILDEDSLLLRSVHNVLNSEQYALFESSDRERRSARYECQIEMAVGILELSAPLTNAQRREVIAALKKLTKPPRKFGALTHLVVMYQMANLPDAAVKTLFDDAQWKAVRAQIDVFKGMRERLKKSGQLPEDEDETEKDDARPVAGKK